MSLTINIIPSSPHGGNHSLLVRLCAVQSEYPSWGTVLSLQFCTHYYLTPHGCRWVPANVSIHHYKSTVHVGLMTLLSTIQSSTLCLRPTTVQVSTCWSLQTPQESQHTGCSPGHLQFHLWTIDSHVDVGQPLQTPFEVPASQLTTY